MLGLVDTWVQFAVLYARLYCIAAQYMLWELALRLQQWFKTPSSLHCYPVADPTVAVVTGGSRGIGYEVVRRLLGAGAEVLVGSRSPERCEALRDRLVREFPGARVEFLRLDLGSMKSVQNFARRVLERDVRLDLLVCNAGIMFEPYRETEDGFESHLSVNYLGHCLLTALLLPCLEGSRGRAARIVNVTSCVHKASRVRFEDLHGRRAYCRYHAYCQSKLAQVLWTRALGRRLEGLPVTVTCVHPGIVDTDLYRNVWWTPLVSGILFRTAEEGAAVVVRAALCPELEGVNGAYLEDERTEDAFSGAPDLRERLWEATRTALEPWVPDLHV